jgi:hypothetical protein
MLIAFFLLASPVFGQNTTRASTNEPVRYPLLIHAELPLYPVTARYAHFSGTVEVQVTVEKGEVTDAKVKSVRMRITNPNDPENRTKYDDRTKLAASAYLTNSTLANVRTWRFQPENPATTFIVTYVYRLDENKKEPLSENKNPSIQLDLPRLVQITARPLEGTCSDCPPVEHKP